MTIKRGLGVLIAALVLMASAFAGTLAPVNVTANVQVWTGNGVTDFAALPAPSGAADYEFTYTGAINFQNNNCQTCSNTFGEFGFTSGNTSNFTSGTQAGLLGTTMSTPGFVDNSYLLFTFTLSTAAGTPGTLSHDDGASLYGVGGVPLVFSPGVTSDITNSFAYNGAGQYQITYVESNGAPSDLVLSAEVPEPGSLLLFGSGLVGLAGLIRRKTRG